MKGSITVTNGGAWQSTVVLVTSSGRSSSRLAGYPGVAGASGVPDAFDGRKMSPVPLSRIVPTPVADAPPVVTARIVNCSESSYGMSLTIATRTRIVATSPGVASPSAGIATKLPGT